MNRRSFFGTFLGALLCKFLRKPKINPTRVDTPDMSRWGALLPPCNMPKVEDVVFRDAQLVDLYPVITDAKNVVMVDGTIRTLDPAKPSSFRVCYVTRNGYITAPSPLHVRRPESNYILLGD